MQMVISAVIGAGLVGLAWWVYSLNSRFKAALGGSDAKQLEGKLREYFEKVSAIQTQGQLQTQQLKQLAARLDLASQKISIVRFNPFGDTGGDQSFSLAVLDAHNSGYVLTSIHGRENTRTYIKPVDKGLSKYVLSKEEKQAMEQASHRVPKTSEAKHG